MGAEVFTQYGTGKTVQEAFATAAEKAAYDHGHSGYTGSLAEKHHYVEIKIPEDFLPEEKRPDKRAERFADKLINDSDERIDDKWGPAGAIVVKKDKDGVTVLFFGWASS